ncbi:MAG: long-chain fatty acid--CoA ligase [Myxococcales bacterium]|nr:long-chain fatty acid--CoA ligase [Myxococcales bacterium]
MHFSWSEYWEAVRETAKGLIALGHKKGECVAIAGANRTEWVICQFGIVAAGGIPAPGYPTNTTEQTAHILRNSEAKIAIADTSALLDQYRAAVASDSTLSDPQYVCMLDEGDKDATSLDALRAKGKEEIDEELDARTASATPEDTGLLIYTSGTTGVAKGVELDGGGMLAMTESLINHMPDQDLSGYRSVSYLPLCHVAEQMMTNFMHLKTGGEVYFCPTIAELKDYLLEVQPTIFAAVPRVWEKFQAALEAKLGQATGVKAKLASWALKTELAAAEAEMKSGREVQSLQRTLANKLVISKIQAALGLDQIQMAGTAAAPISVDTLRFFASIGLKLQEWYGMSETTGIVSGNPLGKIRFGTVGLPVSGVEIKIADDGEIIAKGRNMTRGYLRMPEKTAELIDEDGWLRTGDLGSFDKDGYLKITGRKKDILITAGGKNVAPAEMESLISPIPGVAQVVVVGDRQPYLSALITFDVENLSAFAGVVGAKDLTIEALASNEAVQEHLQKQIEEICNSKVARYQTIKKICSLPVEFSVDGGELTPTMKVRRNVVYEKYASEIDSLYA